MPLLSPRALNALERFNAAHPYDHNAHYHRLLLRQLPPRFAHALDVGCGSGDLARLLAERAEHVRALDADPHIIDRAHALTPHTTPVTFTTGQAPDALPHGPFDVITCLAALHHMPFTPTLRALRALLAPDGILLVLGLYRQSTPIDHLLSSAAIPTNLALGWLHNRGRPAPRPVAMTAPTLPVKMTFPHILHQAQELLPGARLRRHLFWRYTLFWRNS